MPFAMSELPTSCIGTTCNVTRIRRSQLPHPTPDWTYLDGNYGPDTFDTFTGYFTEAIKEEPSDPSPIQAYFFNPSSPFNLTASWNHNVQERGEEAFSISLLQLMISFWMAIVSRYIIPNGNNFIDFQNVIQAYGGNSLATTATVS